MRNAGADKVREAWGDSGKVNNGLPRQIVEHGPQKRFRSVPVC